MRAESQQSTHAPLVFPRGLVTVLGPIVHAGSRLDEDMLDASQGGDPGLGDRVTEELVDDDLAWHGAAGPQALEEALCCRDVASLVQQHIRRRAMLTDSAP